MTAQTLLLCLSFYQTPEAASIKLYQGNFIVRSGDKRVEVPIESPKEKPLLSVSFRKNKNYAVWDDRGLSIRIGNAVKSTKLEAIATSPKVWERPELLNIVDLIRQKKRSAGVSALSGSKRIGSKVYFLPRWEDSSGKTWLEALISIDLDLPTYHPTFLARLPGTTLADKPIDDRLFMLGDRMTSVVTEGKDWGIAKFDLNTDSFDFLSIGQGLSNYVPLTNRVGAFIESSPYGSRIGGRADLESGGRKELAEARGEMKFIDDREPLVVLIKKGDESRLINTATGAELPIPDQVVVKRTSLGLLVWKDEKSPKHAWLYDMNRWTQLAEWVTP